MEFRRELFDRTDKCVDRRWPGRLFRRPALAQAQLGLGRLGRRPRDPGADRMAEPRGDPEVLPRGRRGTEEVLVALGSDAERSPQV